MANKVILLMSGGIDSVCALAYAVKTYGENNVKAVTFIYDQKNEVEINRAKFFCDKFKVLHLIFDLRFLFTINRSYCSLTKESLKPYIYGKKLISILDKYPEPKDKYKHINYAYPDRNSVFITCASSIGLQIFNNEDFLIFQGIYNAEGDISRGYTPDTSEYYLECINKLLEVSTLGIAEVFLWSSIKVFTKDDLLNLGINSGLTKSDLMNTWSCFCPDEEVKYNIECGWCSTCCNKIEVLIRNTDYTDAELASQFNLTLEQIANRRKLINK